MTRPKSDLKCREGPARNVRPEDRPPLTSPDNAILMIGTSVDTVSFLLKKLDSSRIDADLIEPLFNIFSKIDINFPLFVG
jgi:hypothetical protein